MTIQATYYKKPHGRKEVLELNNIREEDAEYLKENNVFVSLESGLQSYPIVYFDDGHLLDDDETPDEIIVIGHSGKSCEDCMSEGVKRLKQRRGDPK